MMSTKMASRIATFAVAGTMVLVTQAQASLIHLDISHMFNYDAIATPEELSYALGQGQSIAAAVGNHTVVGNRSFSSTTIPSSGLVNDDYFEIGKGLTRKFDQEDPATGPMANSIRWSRNSTITVALLPEQRQQYSDINFLFVSERNNDSFSRSFTASVEVKYVGDGTWHEIWFGEKTNDVVNNNNPGGSFGSAGVSGGGLNSSSDPDATWELAHEGLRVDYVSGSSQLRPFGAYMWKFADNLALDGSKELEQFRMTLTGTGGSTRTDNQTHLFATSANLIPEPASMALLGLGGLMLMPRRRRGGC